MKLIQMRIVFTVVLLLTALVVLIAPKPAHSRPAAPACAEHPILQTAAGAHRRAERGWDSEKVVKHQGAIERVRIQARCAPSQRGRAHVRNVIERAKHDYREAKRSDELVGVSSTYAAFAFGVADGTGLGPRVVAAWAIAEGGPADNPLNIGPGNHYGSLSGGIRATVNLLHEPLYSGVLRSAKGSDSGQISAIAASSWCPGCAGYESLLRGVYARIGLR